MPTSTVVKEKVWASFEEVRGRVLRSVALDELSQRRGPILSLFSLVQFALFVVVAWWVRNHRVNLKELKIGRLSTEDRPFVLRYAAEGLSNLCGSPLLLNCFAAPVVIALWRKRLKLEAAMIVSSSAVLILARTLVRVLVQRPRPALFIARFHQRKHSKSFPSGHVSTAVTMWGWLMMVRRMIWTENRRWQKALVSLPPLGVLLVGPARVYLAKHWVSDIVGGYLLGGTVLTASMRVYLALKSKRVLAAKGQEPL